MTVGSTTSRPQTNRTQQTQQVQQAPQAKPAAPARPATAAPAAEAPVSTASAASRQYAAGRARGAEALQMARVGNYVPAPSLDQVRAGEGKIARGMSGDSVKEMQRKLNEAGANPPLALDGKFGPKTEAALLGFQRSRDITDTGVLGKTTLQAMDRNAPVTRTDTQPATNQANGGRVGNVDRATAGMTEAQKYDYYQNMIRQNGGQFRTGPGDKNVLSVRTPTNTHANNNQGVYDDKTVMLWTDRNGTKHVREYQSNTDPSARYEGRYGADANGDGRRDLGRLPTGYYEYQMGSSSTLGRVLRPTQNQMVERDTNHDGNFNDGARSSAGQSILFHAGGNSMTGSAGCQTMPPAEYNRFWADLTRDGGNGRIGYTLVNE